MQPDDLMRLRHMLEAAQKALNFIENWSRNDLDTDEMLSLSLVRLLEIVGEAAARVSPETRSQLPTIPWRDVVGMRNQLIHAYADVDLDIVWETVAADLPVLASVLLPFLERPSAWPASSHE